MIQPNKILTIVNLTPNSFSDGGLFFDPQSLKNRLEGLLSKGQSHQFDFGAQSTAPQSQPIDGHEEFKRFEHILFPVLDEVYSLAHSIGKLQDLFFSIDTYRPEVFFGVYERIRATFPHIYICWNDVSGQYDQEGLNVIETVYHRKKDLRFKYVLGHTFVSNRVETPFHSQKTRQDLNPAELLELLKDYFSTHEILRHLPADKIILDPCLGFSKNREQNIYVLKHLSELILGQKIKSSHPWLIAISRKSFLREVEDGPLNFGPSEKRQNDYFQSLRPALEERDYFLRIHQH
jgi:dihydropteroate synthase